MSEAAAPVGKRRNLVKRIGKKLFRGVLLEHLARQSRVPNDPVLDPALFPWIREIQAGWPAMRAELEEQLKHRAELPRFQDISPDQYRISPDNMRRTFVFYGFGERSELNCGLCPETARLLAKVPRLETAFFSILAPGKHVIRFEHPRKTQVREVTIRSNRRQLVSFDLFLE